MSILYCFRGFHWNSRKENSHCVIGGAAVRNVKQRTWHSDKNPIYNSNFMHFPQTNKQANTEKINFAKGRVVLSKRMNFRKSFKRGGVISNPKIYIADFGLLNRAFWAWKWYKRVISGYVFQPITMLNCCTTCISWEIGSYNTFML